MHNDENDYEGNFPDLRFKVLFYRQWLALKRSLKLRIRNRHKFTPKMSAQRDPGLHVTKNSLISGADLGAAKTCEMCKQGLLVDLDDFNVTDFYHKHQQSRVRDAHADLLPRVKVS